jgi:3-oxoacyl-[acyl-carrier protein] reductase
MNRDRAEKPVAIITGGGTGIGAATAARLCTAGWRVAIGFRASADEARATEAELRANGGEALSCRTDVSIDTDCRRLAAETFDRWGRIDALVNSAGTTRRVPLADLDGLSRDDFVAIMDVNLVGAFQMSRAAAPHLRQSDRAAIVNVSSFSAFSGEGSSMAYAASKGALNTLTLSLARTLAPEIRVNAVCPGYVDTRWLKGRLNAEEHNDFRTKLAAMTPLRHVVTADHVGDAIAWLVCGAPSVTGQMLVIDGGVHLTVGSPLK